MKYITINTNHFNQTNKHTNKQNKTKKGLKLFSLTSSELEGSKYKTKELLDSSAEESWALCQKLEKGACVFFCCFV